MIKDFPSAASGTFKAASKQPIIQVSYVSALIVSDTEHTFQSIADMTGVSGLKRKSQEIGQYAIVML